jgi:hypothetical protein
MNTNVIVARETRGAVTVRKLATACIGFFGGTGRDHAFTTTDLNTRLQQTGIGPEIGLTGRRSACAVLQRACPQSKQRKDYLPAAFERDGRLWWVSPDYAAKHLPGPATVEMPELLGREKAELAVDATVTV